MKMYSSFLWCLLLLSFTATLPAASVTVASTVEFKRAHDLGSPGDTIVWADGNYQDVQITVTRPGLFVLAQTPGGVVFGGNSTLRIQADRTVFSGVQYVGTEVGSVDIIHVRNAAHVTISQVNMRDNVCNKYLVLEESARYCTVTHCNFERRTNLKDKNILAILVAPDRPGYNVIRYCSFKDFPGGGNDEGMEPIRVGIGARTADLVSRTLVEYCYFTACDGDGEIISSKSTQNVYRFNTFAGNHKAELVLRHGSESVVYGNFFTDGLGGVRIKEGQGHYVYNNYFYRLHGRPIILEDHAADPVADVHIAFNTVVDCAPLYLNGLQKQPPYAPRGVTLANNLFVNRGGGLLFRTLTGNERWLGNLADGPLGVPAPTAGLQLITAHLDEQHPYPGLTTASPAVDAAVTGFAHLPQYPGMPAVDMEVAYDLLQRMRPAEITQRDVGAVELADRPVRPYVSAENTGPAYVTDAL